MKKRRKQSRRKRTKAELKARAKVEQAKRDADLDPDVLVASFFKALDQDHNAWGFDLDEDDIHFAGGLVSYQSMPQVIDWMAENLFGGNFGGAPSMQVDFPDIGKVAFVIAQGASCPRDIPKKLREYNGRYVVFTHTDSSQPRIQN